MKYIIIGKTIFPINTINTIILKSINIENESNQKSNKSSLQWYEINKCICVES